jgi:hypothetical protein
MTEALLIRTPKPKAGESLLGYVLRLSETNGYDTPWHIWRAAGYGQGEMQTPGFDVTRLAAVTGQPPDQLAKHAYLATDASGRRYYQINRQRIGGGRASTFFRLRRPAICTACILECGYASVCWDARDYVACPDHKVLLLERCPACGHALSWFRPGLLTCRCGASFERVTAKPAAEELVALMRVLRCKILGSQPAASPHEGFCGMPMEHLAPVSLAAIWRAMDSVRRLNVDAPYAVSAAATAAEIFTHWPHGFHAYLRRMGTQGIEAGAKHIGFRAQFEKLYISVLKPQTSLTGLAFMREAFVKFGLREWGQATVDEKLLRGAQPKSRYLSASSFADLVGVMRITVKKWLADGMEPAKAVKIGNQTRYVLDAEQARGSQRCNDHRLRLREAAGIVGLPVSVLRELKRLGQYSTIVAINRRAGFWEVDLAAFRQRLVSLSPSASKNITNLEVKSFGSIMRDVKFGDHRAKGAFVADLLTGQIKVTGLSGTSIASLLVRQSDVEAFRLRWSTHQSGGALSRRATAAMLVCSEFAVDGLVMSGHLERRQDSRCGILRESVIGFGKRWISANALAKEVGTSAASIATNAARLGASTLRVSAYGNHAAFVAVDEAQQVRREAEDKAAVKRVRAQKVACAVLRIHAKGALMAYLVNFRDSGEALPMRGGKPNRIAIAKACGFSRSRFYDCPELLQLLDGQERRKASNAFEEHQRRLDSYLSLLKAAGTCLPMCGGRVNLLAVSSASGIPRNAFYNSPELARIVFDWSDTITGSATAEHETQVDKTD